MTSMHGDYERQQLNKIEKWESSQPSHIAKAVGFFASPLTWAARKMIPDIAMERALNAAFDVASAVSGSQDLMQDAKKLGFEANEVIDLAEAPLHVSDSLSAMVLRCGKGLAAAEGAVTGLGGLPGLAADIPALIVLAIRTIRKIGFCYGFDTSEESERPFVINAFSAGAANTMQEKEEAVKAAMDTHNILDCSNGGEMKKTEGEIFGRQAFKAAVRNLAKQLCINFARRKALQVVPVVGGGVGAAMNVMFLSDIGEAAVRLYQKRRLEISAVDISNKPVKRE